MTTLPARGLSPHLTYKANRKQTRYGWLRLTPAHSVYLLAELLESSQETGPVLDPFCGTGTTALVCAERGISCDTTDINPFLVWLAGVKTRRYTDAEIAALPAASDAVMSALVEEKRTDVWTPPLHQIEKWWDAPTRYALGRALGRIQELAETLPAATVDLLKIAFCRVLIERANVSFGHQSMSFKKANETLTLFTDETTILESWRAACRDIERGAASPIAAPPCVRLLDARHLSRELPRDHYAGVLTSPPYPNRISYIRELRPYMYWLGYLHDGRQAGELDWQAIGGTWGCATSNLTKWSPTNLHAIPYKDFDFLEARIAAHSPLLACYVRKYFDDMTAHIAELFAVVKPGGSVHYIVGNSKFYNVLLPVEAIFAALFAAAGLEGVTVRPIRKRTSKKELFEYVVSAQKR